MNTRWQQRLRSAAVAALALIALVALDRTQPVRAADEGAEAEITVIVPEDAEVFFDGTPTIQKGAKRLFLSPTLPSGKHYHYEIMARWQKDGKPVEQTRSVKLAAGAQVRVNFLDPVPESKPVLENKPKLTEAEALQIATDAYIYGYPLITMEMTRRVMTNAETPKNNHAPMGQFYNSRTYPDASFKDVTAPNADTLYSTAWLDIGKEPYVLSLPDEGDRYFLIPMLDAWTNLFQVPGKRTTGDKAQNYAITGPNWKGTLPEGVTEYKSPTSMVWILGRTYCTGTPEDYKAVHAIQDKYALVPLSAYGKPYTPPKGKIDPAIDMNTPVREQVNRMDVAAYFKLLAALMKDNPPAQADASIVARMAKLGLVPGQSFDLSKLSPAAARGLAAAPKAGQASIMAQFKTIGKKVNGWEVFTKTGVYGTNYAERAFVTAIGLGANRPQDAVYPTSEADAAGKPYSGANSYVMHFPKDQTPPVNGFWSLTMYNAAYFFVANPLNKYTVSPRNDLKYNADGSLDLYLQHESPGKDKEPNWLPAPEGKFILMLRLYWPKEKAPSIIDGSWTPPAAKMITKSIGK